MTKPLPIAELRRRVTEPREAKHQVVFCSSQCLCDDAMVRVDMTTFCSVKEISGKADMEFKLVLGFKQRFIDTKQFPEILEEKTDFPPTLDSCFLIPPHISQK